MKICTICKSRKREVSFYRDSKHVGGYRSSCKQCYRKRYKYVHSKKKNETWRRYASSEKGIITLLLNNAKDRAKKSGKDYNLDGEWLKESLDFGVCPLSGLEFQLEKGTNGRYRANPFGPSIDRIDPFGGYTKENCRVICFCVNMAMSDWGDDNLLKMAKAIVAKAATWK